MTSFAPGCISRRFFMAAGFEMPSHVVDLSRCRSANEYSEGSVFSREAEEISIAPGVHAVHSTSPRAPCVAANPKGLWASGTESHYLPCSAEDSTAMVAPKAHFVADDSWPAN